MLYSFGYCRLPVPPCPAPLLALPFVFEFALPFPLCALGFESEAEIELVLGGRTPCGAHHNKKARAELGMVFGVPEAFT